MFGAGRYSIPRPVTRNLEDLDSVQSVLLHSFSPAQSIKLSSPLKSIPVNTEDENTAHSKEGTPEPACSRTALQSRFISNKCAHMRTGDPLVSETLCMRLSVT